MTFITKVRFSAENSATQATAEKALRDAFKTPEGQKLIKNVVQFGKNKKVARFEKVFDVGRDLGKGFESVNGVVKSTPKLTKIKVILEPNTKEVFRLFLHFPSNESFP